MKDRARLIISIIFLSPLIALSATTLQGIARAETALQEEQTQTQTQTEEQIAAKQKRIEERKQKYQTRFTQAQLLRTKFRCTAAQQKMASIKTRITAIEKGHTARHAKLVERLEAASDKLRTHGVDTAEYDSYVNELKTKIATTQQTFTDYIAALGDAADLDCTADVEAFRASLEEARTMQQSLRKQTTDTKLYLRQTVKPALGVLLQNLQSKAGSVSNE